MSDISINVVRTDLGFGATLARSAFATAADVAAMTQLAAGIAHALWGVDGAAAARAVIDDAAPSGGAGTVFEDVAAASRALGNVRLRQLHAHVDVDGADAPHGPGDE